MTINLQPKFKSFLTPDMARVFLFFRLAWLSLLVACGGAAQHSQSANAGAAIQDGYLHSNALLLSTIDWNADRAAVMKTLRRQGYEVTESPEVIKGEIEHPKFLSETIEYKYNHENALFEVKLSFSAIPTDALQFKKLKSRFEVVQGQYLQLLGETKNNKAAAVQVEIKGNTGVFANIGSRWSARADRANFPAMEVENRIFVMAGMPMMTERCRKREAAEMRCGTLLSLVSKGDIDQARTLLEAYPKLVNCEEDSATPLTAALYAGGKPELVQFLLDAGAAPNMRPSSDIRPLSIAAKIADPDRSLELVTLLLRYNANPNINQNFSALHFAAERCDWQVVSALIEAHADPNDMGMIRGHPPLTEAVWAKQSQRATDEACDKTIAILEPITDKSQAAMTQPMPDIPDTSDIKIKPLTSAAPKAAPAKSAPAVPQTPPNCSAVTCAANSDCAMRNNAPACVCRAGFVPDPSGGQACVPIAASPQPMVQPQQPEEVLNVQSVLPGLRAPRMFEAYVRLKNANRFDGTFYEYLDHGFRRTKRAGISMLGIAGGLTAVTAVMFPLAYQNTDSKGAPGDPYFSIGLVAAIGAMPLYIVGAIKTGKGIGRSRRIHRLMDTADNNPVSFYLTPVITNGEFGGLQGGWLF